MKRTKATSAISLCSQTCVVKGISMKRKQTNLLCGVYHSLPLHYFDQRRLDIIYQVEYGVHDRLHITLVPPLWDLLPHQIEGNNGF